MTPEKIESPLRRHILAGGAGLLASLLPTPTWARTKPSMADEFWIRPRTVRLQHTSGEKLVCTYWSDGQLVRPAYDELSWFLRDRVDQKAVYMDPVLLDILYGFGGWLDHFGIREPMLTHSAYRTYSRNARTEGAALAGFHPKGKAWDGRIRGVNTSQTAAFGRWLGGGGVGWYPSKNFTHIDSGRVRSWRG